MISTLYRLTDGLNEHHSKLWKEIMDNDYLHPTSRKLYQQTSQLLQDQLIPFNDDVRGDFTVAEDA